MIVLVTLVAVSMLIVYHVGNADMTMHDQMHCCALLAEVGTSLALQ